LERIIIGSQKENYPNIYLILAIRVHLIRKETIEDFAKHNAQSRVSFAEWLSKIRYADWKAPVDIQDTFQYTDLLGNGSNWAVFDINGNNYRMIC
jgi:mRNA interferase HigB